MNIRIRMIAHNRVTRTIRISSRNVHIV